MFDPAAFCRLPRLWAALFLFVAQVLKAIAAVTVDIPSVADANYTGVIVASDLENPSPVYNRNYIGAAGSVHFVNNGTVSETGVYVFGFRLLDRSSHAVALSGYPGSVRYVTNSVTVPAGRLGELTKAVNATLIPNETLDYQLSYGIELTVYSLGSRNQLVKITSLLGTFHRYLDFPSHLSGDPEVNVHGDLVAVAPLQRYMVASIPGIDQFTVTVDSLFHRYDGFSNAPVSTPVVWHLQLVMRDAATFAPIPLVQDTFTFTNGITTYTPGIPNAPATTAVERTIAFSPALGTSVPAGSDYTLTVTLSHDETPGNVQSDDGFTTPAGPFLRFTGELDFGPIRGTLHKLGNVPLRGLSGAGFVNTSLAIPTAGGELIANPGISFGDGSALNVQLGSDGVASLSIGTVGLNNTATITGTVNGVRYRRSNVSLTPSGGTADFFVYMPTGFGISVGEAKRKLLNGGAFNGFALTDGLVPAGSPMVAQKLWGAEETKPFWFEASDITWQVSLGRFLFTTTGTVKYVRADQLAELAQIPDNLTQDRAYISNDGHFAFVKGTTRNIIVRAGQNGDALMSGEVEFGPGLVAPHFPFGGLLGFASGIGQFLDDAFVTGLSLFDGATTAGVNYRRDGSDTPQCPGGSELTAVFLKPDNSRLQLTADGGLSAAGSVIPINPGVALRWGIFQSQGTTNNNYAHQTDPFLRSTIHMPGIALRGIDSQLDGLDRPGTLLLSGVNATNGAVTERPGTDAYANGLADYAGMNFRPGNSGAFSGYAQLAGSAVVPFPLTSRSKYYVRLSGISGIHEAASFNHAITLSGYPFTFSSFGLAFLSSQPVASRTDGQMSVPKPSGFNLPFTELSFTGNGGLSALGLPANAVTQPLRLDYWRLDFQPLVVKFERSDSLACDPGNGFLTIGLTAPLPQLGTSLTGTLGFKGDGQIVTAADKLLPEPYDGRFRLPSSLKIHGPASEGDYSLVPVNDAYLNTQSASGAPAVGFANIAGRLDVPFFDDLQVHLQTEGTNDVFYAMGGWPDEGFGSASDNYFTQPRFDPENRGLPSGTTLAAYRGSPNSDATTYRPRARHFWLDVVHFDLPLRWSTSGRTFASVVPSTSDLLVLTANHQVDYLGSKRAELTFGAEITGLPKLDLVGMAESKLQSAFSGVIDSTKLTVGLDAMDTILNAQVRGLFSPVLDVKIQPIVGNLYDALAVGFDPNTRHWKSDPGVIIADYAQGGVLSGQKNFRSGFDSLIGSVPGDGGLLGKLDGSLGSALDAVSQISSLLAKDPNGNRPLCTQLAQKLVGTLASQFLGSVADSALNPLFASVDPTLTELTETLGGIQVALTNARNALKAGSAWSSDLNSIVSNAGASELDNVAQQISTDLTAYINTFKVGVDNPFADGNADAIKAAIRQHIEDRLFGSVIFQPVQASLNQHLYDLDGSLRAAFDSVMQQLNNTIRSALSKALNLGSDSFSSLGGGDIGGTMGAARVAGYAHINGDSLTELRVDLHAKLSVPDDMQLDAYLRIRSLDSEGQGAGCVPAGQKLTEITLGADKANLDWISPGLVATASGKFVLKNDGASTVPAGFGASFQLDGPLELGSIKITKLDAGMAFGITDNYFCGAAAVDVNGWGGSGGVFFGRSCTLEPIQLIDPQVADVVMPLLNGQPFAGAWFYGDAHIPLLEALLGIPATCFLNIEAGLGMGVGFVRGNNQNIYLGKAHMSLEGEVLCLLDVSGTVDMVGAGSTDGLSFSGLGEVTGEIGVCPFCKGFTKDIGIGYSNGGWSVNF